MDQRREGGARRRRIASIATWATVWSSMLVLAPSSVRADDDDEHARERAEPATDGEADDREGEAAHELGPDEGSMDLDHTTPIIAPNRHWQPHWERFSATGALIIGIAEAAAFAVFIAEPVTEPLWVSRLPGDDEVRSALRLQDPTLRTDALVVSNALLGLQLLWPFIADSIVLAGFVHHDEDAALQMALIDGEVLAVAHMILWLTTRLTGRVRPESLECTLANNCNSGVGPVSSFIGGHALMAYASAGLSCVHHAENPWLTGSTGGAIANCVTGMAIATATTFLRISGDRHWMTDSAIGATVGALLGFGMPYLLHYGRARTHRADENGHPILSSLSVLPGGGDGPFGLTVNGSFF